MKRQVQLNLQAVIFQVNLRDAIIEYYLHGVEDYIFEVHYFTYLISCLLHFAVDEI